MEINQKPPLRNNYNRFHHLNSNKPPRSLVGCTLTANKATNLQSLRNPSQQHSARKKKNITKDPSAFLETPAKRTSALANRRKESPGTSELNPHLLCFPAWRSENSSPSRTCSALGSAAAAQRYTCPEICIALAPPLRSPCNLHAIKSAWDWPLRRGPPRPAYAFSRPGPPTQTHIDVSGGKKIYLVRLVYAALRLRFISFSTRSGLSVYCERPLFLPRLNARFELLSSGEILKDTRPNGNRRCALLY